MSIWDNFGKLNKLKIRFKGKTRNTSALIFGNGNNQIAISIKVDISGLDGKPLIIPDEELLKAALIVNYEDGKRLNKEGDNDDYKPWYYTDKNFGYDEPIYIWGSIQTKEVITSRYEQEVIFYLSATEAVTDYASISAGIDIPGVGEFNTSIKGTKTKNGPKGETGEIFEFPQSVEVKAVEPKKLYEIKKSSYATKSRNVSELFYTGGGYSEYGIVYPSKMSDLNIKVISSITYNDNGHIGSIDNSYFKSINFPRNEATLETVKFSENILPDMIIARGGNDFSAYFVFIQRKSSGIEDGSYFYMGFSGNGADYKYRIRSSNSSNDETELVININQFTTALPRTRLMNSNNYKDTVFDIIDNYGNTFQVKFNVDYYSEELFFIE